jgi:2,4-dienoyl-CoA reductase (NADPH2)
LRHVAAQRGHAVTLFEAAERIGGQFNLAKRIPGKEEFEETLRYYGSQLRAHAVDLRLGVRVAARRCWTKASTRSCSPPASSRACRLPRRGASEGVQLRRRADRRRAGRPARGLVGAGGIGFDVAEFLVQPAPRPPWIRRAGLPNGVCGRTSKVPGGLAPPHAKRLRGSCSCCNAAPASQARNWARHRWIHRAALKAKGVVAMSGVEYLGGGCRPAHPRRGAEQLLEVDHVVICAGQEPLRALLAPLQAAGKKTHLVGGADWPQNWTPSGPSTRPPVWRPAFKTDVLTRLEQILQQNQ